MSKTMSLPLSSPKLGLRPLQRRSVLANSVALPVAPHNVTKGKCRPKKPWLLVSRHRPGLGRECFCFKRDRRGRFRSLRRRRNPLVQFSPERLDGYAERYEDDAGDRELTPPAWPSFFATEEEEEQEEVDELVQGNPKPLSGLGRLLLACGIVAGALLLWRHQRGLSGLGGFAVLEKQ
jgi:hypothetical protein